MRSLDHWRGVSPETTRGLRAITTVVLVVVCVAWTSTAVIAVPVADAASRRGARATLRVQVLGLPQGQAPDAVLTGPHGLDRAVHTDQFTFAHATPGAYRLTLRPTTIRHASGPIRRGATATALHPTMTVSVRAGGRAVLRATYSQLTNPGLHVLSHGVEGVRGPTEDPSAVVLPGDVSLARGNILSAPPNSVAPRGVLGRVTSVAHAHGETTVGLVSVSVYEVAPNYEFDVPLVDATAAASGFSESCGPTVGVEPYRNIKDVSFTGGWSTADVFGVHVVDGVRAAVHFTVEAGVNVTAGTGVGCSLSVGFSADGMAGPIPVTAGIEAELEAEAALGGALSSGGSLRVEAGGHTVGPVLLPDVAFTSPHFSLTAKELVAASAGVGLTVKAGIGAGGVASITLNVGTSLDFTAKPGSCAWAARFGQFSAEGELLEWTLSTPKTPALFTLPIGGNYCANTSPSPPSSGGSGSTGSGGSSGGGSGGGGSETGGGIVPIAQRLTANYSTTCEIVAAGVNCWGGNPLTPTSAPQLAGASAIATSSGIAPQDTCAVVNGDVDCWGTNEYGALGNGTTGGSSETPATVAGITGATAVATGGTHTCALMTDATVRCWGANLWGELGDGTHTSHYTPEEVKGLGDVTEIAAGNSQSCGLVADGTVYCWGTWGGLGDNTATEALTPIPVVEHAIAVSLGGPYACALTSAGKVPCWGVQYDETENQNNAYECGTSPNEGCSELLPNNARAVSVGGADSCAIVNDGSVECWGYNPFGQLGDGLASGEDSLRVFYPEKLVTGISNATEIAAGANHVCARLQTGAIECWGLNGLGQLGDGSVENQLTPVVATEAISTSSDHVVAPNRVEHGALMWRPRAGDIRTARQGHRVSLR